jgi:hypothetical protein
MRKGLLEQKVKEENLVVIGYTNGKNTSRMKDQLRFFK